MGVAGTLRNRLVFVPGNTAGAFQGFPGTCGSGFCLGSSWFLHDCLGQPGTHGQVLLGAL